MATQKPVEFEEFLPSAGRWLEVHAYPSPSTLTVFFRDITERREQRKQIEFLALHDPLTHLANRTVFQERLKEKLSSGGDLAVMCLDLDAFKEVNDTFGHPAGDELLIQVGKRLEGCTRSGDLIARLGGDEFAIIAPGGRSAVEGLAERILGCGVDRYLISVGTINMRFSIGIAMAPADAVDPDELFKKADIALYRAKTQGGGGFCFFEAHMEKAVLERQSLKADLAKALPNSEFGLAFQPIIGLEEHRVRKFEALIRWQHPARGTISPDRFIPILEETGAINEIGAWVLERTCVAAAGWPSPVGVAVNLSPCQFRSSDLPAMVSSVLTRSGLAPDRLELEITESVLLNASEHNLSMLHSLRAIGVRIALDDFGTGYSSLGYLRKFPFTSIKIDRSFVSDVDQNSEARAIIRSIVNLGESLGMEVTAEGVETRQELDCVRALG